MKNQRWLALCTGIMAIFLLIEGGWTIWIIDTVHRLEVFPGTLFATAEDVALAKSYLPAMYVVAIEGLLFGAIATVGAVGVFTGRLWAYRMLLVASLFLVITALLAISMVPNNWSLQAIFIAFCVSFWWASIKE